MTEKKLLKKIKHRLATEHGLYVTDVKKEAEKIKNDSVWQLDNTELLKEIDLEIEKRKK
jgi:uncharacterized protein YpiB (UPF0302 family)